MQKRLNLLGILILLFLFTGCATLTAEGENVKVTNKASDVKDCTLRGKVHSHGGGSPIIRARNVAAAEWHANTILVDDSDGDMIALGYFCN